MSQSNVIAIFLALAFLIFVTVRGELPKYAAVLVGGSPAGGEGGEASDAVDEVQSGIDNAFSKVGQVNAAVSSLRSVWST